MARSRRKANSPPYEDEHLSPDSSDDSGDDQYDTDPTEPDCEDDQLKDAGDVAQLFAELPRSGIRGEHLAALFGLKYLMQTLLEKSPLRIQSKDKFGWKSLHFTARYGHETVSKLLLENGANIESSDRSGSTPLCVAAARGQETVVNLLLDNGAKIESSDIGQDIIAFGCSLWPHDCGQTAPE